MTKENYYDMCEQLGTPPVEEDIPWEIEDFPEIIQSCFIVYNKLPDMWEYMGGNYIGKDFTLIFRYLSLYEIRDEEEQKMCLDIIHAMDSTRISLIANKNKEQASTSKKK